MRWRAVQRLPAPRNRKSARILALFACKEADALKQNRFHKNLRSRRRSESPPDWPSPPCCGATSVLSVVTWQSPPPGTTAARTRFVNVAAAAGLTFVHRHSPTADKHYPESVPGGVAVFDYNGDGRPDIFFTNGAEMPTLVEERRRLRQPALSQRRRHEVHRRHRGIGRGRRRLRDGRGGRRLRQRRPRRSLRRRRRAQPAAAQPRRRHASKTSPSGRAHRQRRVGGRRRLVRLRQRRPARSAGDQLRALVGRKAAASAATRREACASTAIPAISRACRTASTAIAATARSRTSRPQPGSPDTSARG